MIFNSPLWFTANLNPTPACSHLARGQGASGVLTHVFFIAFAIFNNSVAIIFLGMYVTPRPLGARCPQDGVGDINVPFLNNKNKCN